MNLEDWITTKEACQLVDRTRTTINSWRKQNLIDVKYIGEKPLLNKADVLAARKKKEGDPRES